MIGTCHRLVSRRTGLQARWRGVASGGGGGAGWDGGGRGGGAGWDGGRRGRGGGGRGAQGVPLSHFAFVTVCLALLAQPATRQRKQLETGDRAFGFQRAVGCPQDRLTDCPAVQLPVCETNPTASKPDDVIMGVAALLTSAGAAYGCFPTCCGLARCHSSAARSSTPRSTCTAHA